MGACRRPAEVMATALETALKAGNLFAAFSAAGDRMEKHGGLAKERGSALGHYSAETLAGPATEERAGELEAMMAEATHYMACSTHGGKQPQHWTALGFIDNFGPNARTFSVCRAKNLERVDW